MMMMWQRAGWLSFRMTRPRTPAKSIDQLHPAGFVGTGGATPFGRGHHTPLGGRLTGAASRDDALSGVDAWPDASADAVPPPPSLPSSSPRQRCRPRRWERGERDSELSREPEAGEARSVVAYHTTGCVPACVSSRAYYGGGHRHGVRHSRLLLPRRPWRVATVAVPTGSSESPRGPGGRPPPRLSSRLMVVGPRVRNPPVRAAVLSAPGGSGSVRLPWLGTARRRRP